MFLGANPMAESMRGKASDSVDKVRPHFISHHTCHMIVHCVFLFHCSFAINIFHHNTSRNSLHHVTIYLDGLELYRFANISNPCLLICNRFWITSHRVTIHHITSRGTICKQQYLVSISNNSNVMGEINYKNRISSQVIALYHITSH